MLFWRKTPFIPIHSEQQGQKSGGPYCLAKVKHFFCPIILSRHTAVTDVQTKTECSSYLLEFNFSVIAGGSNFSLYKILTSWNYEKLGQDKIYFAMKSLKYWVLICISAEIHHLILSQISPTHSSSLLFALTWVSLDQDSRVKKVEMEAITKTGVKQKDWR